MRERIQNYVFTPGVGGSGTIKVQGYVETADILVITNVTTNTIIYQFSDPNKGATVTYNPTVDADFPQSQNGVTTMTLDFNTSLMNAADKLQIYVETREVTMRPWHFGTDAIERMRFAQPESLIDADFEYGLQNTKWQSLSLNNNMPAVYENPGADVAINTRGYVTLMTSTSTIADNADTTLGLVNQGTVGDYTPNWVADDYALLINQTNIVPTSSTITANVNGSQQRTFAFSSNTAAFSAGDLVLITKVEPEATTCITSAEITSTATTTLLIEGANTITNGNFIQVLTAHGSSTQWELMAVQSGGGTGTLTVVRQRNGTNATGSNIPASAQIKVLANVEIGNVESITSSTSMQINRGWFNTTPLDFITVGSQIQKLNGGDGANGNLEIVKMTTVGTGVANAAVITRGALSSIPKTSAATSGTVLVRLVGIFQAGTPIANGVGGVANVSIIGLNSTLHGIAQDTYLSTQNHKQPDSEGLYYVAVSETNNLAYYPKKSAGLPLGYPLNQYDTTFRKATAYTGASIPLTSIVSDGANPSTITVTTPYAHGLSPGTPLLVDLSAGTNAEVYASGAFSILSVPTLTTFTYQAKRGLAVSGSISGTIVIKPNSYFVHRPFDGGIAMTCGSPHHGATAARQTKKYFRYQSGKGLFFTSGTLFGPTFDIAQCSATGTTANDDITVVTEQNHQLQIGAIVRVSGIVTSGYNATRRVTQILSDRSFKMEAGQTLGATTPIFRPQPRINVTGWYGGVVRAGMFDDQNGMFWEYDGEKLSVVKRSSTYQIAGLASVQANSNLITGDGTCRFRDQLKIGDNIVVRGMTHTVTSVTDQNTFTVIPEYRGARNESRVKVLLVQDQRVPQEEFNVDVMDGTGPSGYVIDPAKMQMIMIQYTWYGAGFIEYGVRGPNGKMILAHRIKNNNVNDEAFMRSGNLPCRYEASANGALTKLFDNITDSQTFFTVADGTYLPGNVSVEYPVYLSVENEIIRYTGITKNVLGFGNTVANVTGVTRASSLTQWIEGASQTFTQGSAVSHEVGSGVYVLGCTAAPTITHWGSAVIMDGGYQKDSGFSFTFNRQNVALPSTLGAKTTLFLMRLAPAVSNTIIGSLGQRDLVNRAELALERLIVNLTGGRYLVEGVLNPNNIDIHTTTFVNLNTTSFGNQPSFTQFSTNIQFQGTTVGGLLPQGLSYQGTAPFRGPVRTTGSITGTARATGSASGTITYTSVAATTTSGAGTGLIVTVRYNNSFTTGNYSARGTVITIVNGGSGFRVGETVKVLGTALGGTTTTNDLTFTVTAIGSDALSVNNVVLETLTGAGAGANISLSSLSSTANLTTYDSRTFNYSINSTGDGYATGDTLKILGFNFGANAANVTNDMTLTVQSVAGSTTGGERLFAIPISSSSAGELDLRNVKQLGTSAVPGNGVYPDGPEVLAITITCIAPQSTQQYADVQLSFTESQA
jgi:hypothetical protein